MFDYRASWISINHQDGDGGQFELYRKGEWLTKGMASYDNNGVGMTTPYHNTLAIQNRSANGTPNLAWFESGIWANGSQWMEGENAGDPSTVFSTGANYAYASSNLANLYNKPDIWAPNLGATDVTQATPRHHQPLGPLQAVQSLPDQRPRHQRERDHRVESQRPAAVHCRQPALQPGGPGSLQPRRYTFPARSAGCGRRRRRNHRRRSPETVILNLYHRL